MTQKQFVLSFKSFKKRIVQKKSNYELRIKNYQQKKDTEIFLYN